MQAWQKTALSLAAVFALVLGALYPVTQGLRAISADTARQVAFARSPRPMAPLPMVDAQGKPFLLSESAGATPQWTIATLMYTRCVSVCRASAAGMAYLQEMLAEQGLQDRVGLLSLSFDPGYDTPAGLQEYAEQMRADPARWRFATVRQETDLKTMLDLFNIIVLPDGMGGFDHNAALFLIDPDGRIMRAYSVAQPDLMLGDLLAMLSPAPPA